MPGAHEMNPRVKQYLQGQMKGYQAGGLVEDEEQAVDPIAARLAQFDQVQQARDAKFEADMQAARAQAEDQASGPTRRVLAGVFSALAGRDPSASIDAIRKQDADIRNQLVGDVQRRYDADTKRAEAQERLRGYLLDLQRKRDSDVGKATNQARLTDAKVTKLGADAEAAKKRADATAITARAKASASASKASEPTVGQQAADRAFGKEYVQWTGTDRGQVARNLDRLREARARLQQAVEQKEGGISGRIVGRTPDLLRREESIRLREDVQAAAQQTLKATLGAQFTEKEGERIMAMAYNQKLSPEENIRKIDSALQELEQKVAEKEAQVAQFEQAGTLAGYRSGGQGAQPQQAAPARKPGIVVVSNGTESFEIDADDTEAIEEARDEGFEVVR